MLYENYQSPWLDDELNILRDAAARFFAQEFLPDNEKCEISRMYADARVQKIYGGTNEIMKELIGRTLG
jgi:alkylation response protein AidB-like acyl-CoA dehydrogenase